MHEKCWKFDNLSATITFVYDNYYNIARKLMEITNLYDIL